jgi:hypothetical protein
MSHWSLDIMMNSSQRTERGSFNQQDAADTTAEMAVRVRPPRSTPRAIEVRPVMPSVIKSLVTDRHYLHSMPAAPRRCYGVYLRDVLAGAAVFTSGPRHGYRLLSACRPQEVSVLARLWLSDELPKNSESRVIGILMRLLRRDTDWKLILSYADPSAGHTGTIYQASGWAYLGMTQPGNAVIVSGERIHSRTCGSRFGSGSIRHLRATGVPAVREPEPGKHRYVYFLDRSWMWRLRGKALPYPKPDMRTRKFPLEVKPDAS